MALQSMTGFSRAEGSDDSGNWAWEMRSVNGKSLDLRLRLPNGVEGLESEVRNCVSSKLKRGNIQVNLTLEQKSGASVPSLNSAAFEAALGAAKKASEQSGLAMPSLGEILSIKGVMEMAETTLTDGVEKARNENILQTLQKAVDLLVDARLSEGQAMTNVLLSQIDEIEALKNRVENDQSRTADAIRQRLHEQVAKLIEQTNELDAQRLHQEAAILATKSDLREELDRLNAHIASARELLKSEEPVGRKLDFLSQEFNRECNTICSKSNAASVTNAGLEMKVIIDQFREQVQNIQ